MKQLLQRMDTGETFLLDVPAPSVDSGPHLLVRTEATLISAGTERMLVDFGRASLLSKALQQPDRVRQVVAKMRTDGVGATLEAVRAKLDQPIALGYCHAGVVLEVGSGVSEFQRGDRVVTNGPHAEIVRVAARLAAKIPDGVQFEAAAFTPVAAIALQGIRLANPTLGETVVVYGLGLIGLLAVQLLAANGCRVIGIDRSPGRLALGSQFGATVVDSNDGSVANHVIALTGGIGADAVVMTLASDSDEPMHEAAEMSRQRGRLILVGVSGLKLRRDDFYKKELSFQVSCSYGPGRYDPSYESRGIDYPLPYVRWSEQRNFDAVLHLMARGRVDPQPLITHRVPFERASSAYDVITADSTAIGVVLKYGSVDAKAEKGLLSRMQVVAPNARPLGRGPRVGIIGAGNFATRVLLPLLSKAGATVEMVATEGGTSGALAARKLGARWATTDVNEVMSSDVDAVFILTRHNTHAKLVLRALAARKHVFVEKPLAITGAELQALEKELSSSTSVVMVGFNRRFAPLTSELRSALRGRVGALSLVATINAGFIPADHWTQDPNVGGGRIVGEACHWIDLARSLVGYRILDAQIVTARDTHGSPVEDIAHIIMSFEDGSTAAIHYLASGANTYPKERIECFVDGKTYAIDNWRRLQQWGTSGGWWSPKRRPDKGHSSEVKAFLRAIEGKDGSPLSHEEMLEVTRWSIKLAGRVRTNLQDV